MTIDFQGDFLYVQDYTAFRSSLSVTFDIYITLGVTMKVTTRSVIITAVAVVLTAGFLMVEDSWNAIAKEEIQVFPSESDAAYSGKKESKPAIAVVEKGEVVAVLSDTYGKDYWACYVRTKTNQRGWVLCTSLQNTT